MLDPISFPTIFSFLPNIHVIWGISYLRWPKVSVLDDHISKVANMAKEVLDKMSTPPSEVISEDVHDPCLRTPWM